MQTRVFLWLLQAEQREDTPAIRIKGLIMRVESTHS